MFDLTFPSDVADFVKNAYLNASYVVEYGTGGSTVFAAKNNVPITSVESDLKWKLNLQKYINGMPTGMGRCNLIHIDIGLTKEWGYPVSSLRYRNFPQYAITPWLDESISPDLVLIDGRFRPACFIAAAVFAKNPVRILFDDYADRPYYHFVEDYFSRVLTIGRMAVFDILPFKYESSEILRKIDKFYDPA